MKEFLVIRFLKDLGVSLYGPSGDEEWGQRFVGELEDKLFTELTSNIRDVRLLEGKLRHRLNIYEVSISSKASKIFQFII